MTQVAFDSFVNQAWDDHAAASEPVAARLTAEAPRWLTDAARLAPLVSLVHHVHGQHLGRWQQGRSLISELAASPVCAAQAALTIVEVNAAPSMEAYFAWEAIARTAHAAGEEDTRSRAVAQARVHFHQMDGADQQAFDASLQALQALNGEDSPAH